MKKVICTICLLTFVMCFIPLEVEATRNRTRNPRTRDAENKRVIRAKERKKKIEEGQKEIRARQREKKEIETEKIRQATLKTWDDKKRTTPKPTTIERMEIQCLGPGGLAIWVMARKSEILMKMPKYGTAERWRFDLKRMPEISKVISNPPDAAKSTANTISWRSCMLRIRHRAARSTPQWVMLREWGIPDSVEVLTTKGKWIAATGITEKSGHVPTGRERWTYEYYIHDDILVFTNGKLASWYKENEKIVKIGMPQWVVLYKWGSPKDINRSVGSWGIHEQWVYGNNYLYFEGGILTSFQD